jgi:hypothetical protein
MPENILKVKGSSIQITKKDYISITDIARYKNEEHPDDIVKNWMRNKNTIEFLGLWEKINNTTFKPVEFDRFKIEAGSNSFVLRPKQWITKTKERRKQKIFFRLEFNKNISKDKLQNTYRFNKRESNT